MRSTGEMRSPLKQKPLRRPGQSVQREMDRLVEDRLLPLMVFTCFMWLLALHEWGYAFHWPSPSPRVMTVFALACTGYMVYSYFTAKRRLRRLQLGRDGERVVGQFLEHLRSQGCLVFHDLLGDRFNIDHVVVSPHGIFVIETKTYSKPTKGQADAEYDGERLLINGMEHERDAVKQARALAAWLRDRLQESTGRRFPVRAVVLLPGWYVKIRVKAPEVWVLNPEMLGAFIEREPVLLKAEDVALVSDRIVHQMQMTEQ
jgi:nuclease-like protein